VIAGRNTAAGGAWRTRWAAPPRLGYTSETKPFFLIPFALVGGATVSSWLFVILVMAVILALVGYF
jgi:hypothetical protein